MLHLQVKSMELRSDIEIVYASRRDCQGIGGSKAQMHDALDKEYVSAY